MIHALILAAGESRRMGRAKMLLTYRGSTIIEAVVATARSSLASGVTVVLGAREEEIRAAIAHLPVSIAVNADYRLGMLSSIQCGITSLPPETRAVLLMLGDQPAIPVQAVNAVIDAWKTSGLGFALPTFGGQRGHPLLMDLRYRDAVLALAHDAGMRALLSIHADQILHVPVESPAVLKDVDTPEDYSRLKADG